MNSKQTNIVRSEVVETEFGLYTDDELRSLSVCKITSPISFDNFGNVLHGGLYDPKLGPTDQRSRPCVTCSLPYVHCPGHAGHIELCSPVYHPLQFSSLFMILRCKCAKCHRLRLSKSKLRLFLIKLKLIEMNDIETASKIEDSLNITTDSSNESKDNLPNNIESELRSYEDRYISFITNTRNKTVNMFLKGLQRTIIESFWKTVQSIKKCDHCGAYSPGLRKDGFTKIFLKPLNKRLRESMGKQKSALESMQMQDNENDSADETKFGDESDEDEKISENDKYLAPIEVEAHLKLLWAQHADLLDYIWGRAQGRYITKDISNCWQMFFQRVILVAPSRFRPASIVGNMTTEHAQNISLCSIITLNEQIFNIMRASRKEYSTSTSSEDMLGEALQIAVNQAEDIMNIDESQLTTINTTNNSTNSTSNPVYTMSKLVSLWIEIQNTVNCYIDSAKDSNILAAKGSTGIRQLLERKEGLFRMHMMGKRVNYCCRSVISPDNFIGTNEIGIPVQFAKVLHYPTPVTDWNVKFLRQLVENGPTKYPVDMRNALCTPKVVPIEDDYVIGKELGRGRFSRVCECVNKATGLHYAVKIIDKTTIEADEKSLLRTEIAVLKLVNHPNIIRMEGLYESRNCMYIVMEMLKGGELFERIVGKPRFTEADAAKLIRPLLESVAYLHDLGIVHRDLKPENILCGENLEDLKIADFGLSK
eukprot:gene9274-19252_t